MPASGPLAPDLIPSLVRDLIRPGRVHEATGPGRRAFAAALAGVLAGALDGPGAGAMLWIQEGRERDRLCPQGLAPFLDPGRLVLARPAGALAVLQTAEEALRSGAVGLVVAELAQAPDLTASRRLQLAAGAGASGEVRGLCLVPEGRLSANAAETRWRCAPLPGGRPRQLWELVKNKRGRLGCWEVAWPGGGPGPVSAPGIAADGRGAGPTGEPIGGSRPAPLCA